MAAEAQIQQIIDYAQGQATDASEEAKSLMQDAVTASFGGLTSAPALPALPEIPDIILPAPPTAGDGETYKTWFDDIFNKLVPDFDNRFDDFIATFFPKILECLQTTTDNWLCDTITNGGTGIPAAVEDQIWQRARARELAEGMRQKYQAVDQWAARGFPLPAGAMVGAVADADQAISDRVSTISRDTAIKNVEIEIENIRFAVAQAIALRLGAIDATVKYLAAWVALVGDAAKIAEYRMNAEQAYYRALSAYYDAVTSAHRLPLEKGKIEGDWEMSRFHDDVQYLIADRQSRIGAALGAAEALGRMAAAALAGQNSFASLNSNTNKKG